MTFAEIKERNSFFSLLDTQSQISFFAFRVFGWFACLPGNSFPPAWPFNLVSFSFALISRANGFPHLSVSLPS